MMVEIQNELENNGKIEIGKERESHDVLQKKKILGKWHFQRLEFDEGQDHNIESSFDEENIQEKHI